MDVRSWWAALLFPGFIAAHSVSAQTPDWMAGIAKVTTRNADLASGTAFVVAIRNDSAFLITGSHVIAGDSSPKIDFVADRNKPYLASIVANNYDDKSRGLAILKGARSSEGFESTYS